MTLGSCDHGNEPVGSIKGGEFLDYPSDSWLSTRKTLLRGVCQCNDNQSSEDDTEAMSQNVIYMYIYF